MRAAISAGELQQRRANHGRWASVALVVSLFSEGPVLRATGPSEPECSSSARLQRACGYAGRPLAEVLLDLRARGLDLIFSSDLVRPGMVVDAEPPPAALRQALDHLLAPFGLEARDGPGGTILVVPGVGSGEGATGAAAREKRDTRARPILQERLRVEASLRDDPAPVASLTREEIERLPTPGEDAIRAIAWLPGITSTDKSAAFSIRGGDPGEALVVLDGLEVDEPFHLKDFLAFSSIVDARAVGRVDLLTGIFPAEYGGRGNGVVDLSTVDALDVGRTIVDANTLNASVLSGGRLGPGGGSWLVSSRFWRPDTVTETISLEGEGLGPSYADLLGKMQFVLPGGSFLSAHVLMSQDDLHYRTDGGDGRVRAADDHRYAWIDVKTPWTPRLYSHTLASSGWVDRSRHGDTTDAATNAARVDDTRSQRFVGLKQDWIFEAGQRSSLKWGFDSRSVEAEYDYRSHAERSDPFAGDIAATTIIDRDLNRELSGSEFGAYVAGRFRIAAPLTCEVGLRHDRQTLTGEGETSPRLSVAYAMGERTILRAGWGRSHQPQGANQLQVEDGVVDLSPAQQTEQRQVDLDHLFPGGIRLGLSIYLNEMTHVRPRYENLFDPLRLFPEVEYDRVRVAPDRGRAGGVEIALSREGRHALGWSASYALASAEEEIEGAWVPRSWDQRQAFRFSLSYRPGERWTIGLAGIYHTGWPTTDLRAERVTNADGSESIRPILGARNAQRYPSYRRLDLKIARRFRLRGGTLDFHLDVTNLDGHENVCCTREIDYLPQADGGVRVDRKDGFWLRQLPVAGLTWEF